MAGGLHRPAVQEAQVRTAVLLAAAPLFAAFTGGISQLAGSPVLACFCSCIPVKHQPPLPSPRLQRGGGERAAAVRGQSAEVERVAGPAGAQGDGADHDGEAWDGEGRTASFASACWMAWLHVGAGRERVCVTDVSCAANSPALPLVQCRATKRCLM